MEKTSGAPLSAQAGTLESNDIFIRLTGRTDGGRGVVTLESIVMQQFGEDILRTIEDCMAAYGVPHVDVQATDRGALECTIRARMEAAAARYKELGQ